MSEQDNDTIEDTDDEQKEDVNDSDTSAEDEGTDDGEDLNRPVTMAEFLEAQKSINNNLAVIRRHATKDSSKNIIQPKPASAGKDPIVNSVRRLEDIERKRTFGYENSLSPEEVDAVFKLDPKLSRKTLDNPFVQGGLERLRAQKNADANIPSGHSARKFGTEGKNWNELPATEKEANFADVQKAILAKKR